MTTDGVIGLGQRGVALVTRLAELGANVIAIDGAEACAEAIEDESPTRRAWPRLRSRCPPMPSAFDHARVFGCPLPA
jgi:6-phosphogluconate dehydrogenase (decarboxylating)